MALAAVSFPSNQNGHSSLLVSNRETNVLYYFDIFDGDHWVADDLGVDCDADRQARDQAVLALCEMARELLPANGPEMDLTIRVRSSGALAFSVRLHFFTEPGPALTDLEVMRSHRR
jgi:hypothetical protein